MVLSSLNISFTSNQIPKCNSPKKVFAYHVWLPFDGKQSRFYGVSLIYKFMELIYSMSTNHLPQPCVFIRHLLLELFSANFLHQLLCRFDYGLLHNAHWSVGYGFYAIHTISIYPVERRFGKFVHHQLKINLQFTV